jgi:hypothetical protein
MKTLQTHPHYAMVTVQALHFHFESLHTHACTLYLRLQHLSSHDPASASASTSTANLRKQYHQESTSNTTQSQLESAMSIYNLTPTAIHYSVSSSPSTATSVSPTSTTPPSPPDAKSPSALLTTLRAHQSMLASQYEAQYTGYLTSYSTETGENVTALLEQQRHILLFQTLLSSFQTFIDALEGKAEEKKVYMVDGDEARMWEIKHTQASREKGVIGQDGGVGAGGEWKGVHGVLR